ncbi:MAG: hypothetical protein KKB02_16005 [Alphaproteobacteria bacterium]|nr:hypothetical protein [Alphaproteobacteria bacterium]
MIDDRQKPGRGLLAEFELPAPGLLRMVLTDSAHGVIDIVERDPAVDGAYAGFLGAIDATGQALPLRIECGFEHVPGRANARKTRIKAVIASACAARLAGTV